MAESEGVSGILEADREPPAEGSPGRHRSIFANRAIWSRFRPSIFLVATVIGIGAIIMIRDAVTSRSVVIDSFDVPPALAAGGLSGKVVAAGVLDVLAKIQAATRTSAERRLLSNAAWTNELSIEVPETGYAPNWKQLKESRAGLTKKSG